MRVRPARRAGTIAVAVVLLLLAGCSSHAKLCEEVCLQFVSDCGWAAWENLAQCQTGCLDDTYRRDDARELLDCYARAASAPTADEASAVVDSAMAAGVFAVEQSAGTFDYDAAVQSAVLQGTCDAFAAVQCRAQAVKRRPTGAFIDP